jgi:hypothetical protein
MNYEWDSSSTERMEVSVGDASLSMNLYDESCLIVIVTMTMITNNSTPINRG